VAVAGSLVSPILRIDFAGLVGKFLDQAERAGVRPVIYLSAYGMDYAPAEAALRAVELDLAARGSLTSTVIRPAWFMEDFSETFLQAGERRDRRARPGTGPRPSSALRTSPP
jgi:uncharacterized protein YbjT (DUF2867 family)